MCAPETNLTPIIAVRGSNESPNQPKHDAHVKMDLVARLAVKMGLLGPNRAHRPAAEETRDVRSRDQFNSDNSG